MSEEIGEAFIKLVNKIWNEGGIPEEWNRGLICSIYKRGDKENVKNYRGITFMDTAYKIYVSILNERMKIKVEEKAGEGQFGFRQGRRTADAIYVMNHVMNRGIKKKKGKSFCFFCRFKGGIRQGG